MSQPADGAVSAAGKVKRASADDVAAIFDGARRVVVVPGYGMAVSQAQHTLRDLTHVLEARGVVVEFGVHPVAGRMPGHMNVLLAEADIPHESVKDPDEINPTFPQTDVVVVVGANDVVNPLAPAVASGPLAGMPVLEVDKAKRVVVVKRGLSPGHSGVDNPLFSAANTTMLFGDGKVALLEVIASLLRKKPRMAERRVGTVSHVRQLSPLLVLFRLAPHEGTRFPDYKAGQYLALRRDDCRLTRRALDADGKAHYVPDLDERGIQKRGPIVHSYSIASAPFETRRDGHLELYLVLESDEWGYAGRLTESLFRVRPMLDDRVGYVDRIVGDFTLDKRAKGFRNVVMVGTGSGLAPFISMVKQLHHEAGEGKTDGVRYTLFHTNRTTPELAYHEELQAIVAEGRFDFAYVASVSRPGPADEKAGLGLGRANNLLRHVFGMPLREDEELRAAEESGGNIAAVRDRRDKVTLPRLPAGIERQRLLERMPPGETVVLTCGNPEAMDDIRRVAEANGMRFEKEDWKHLPAH